MLPSQVLAAVLSSGAVELAASCEGDLWEETLEEHLEAAAMGELFPGSAAGTAGSAGSAGAAAPEPRLPAAPLRLAEGVHGLERARQAAWAGPGCLVVVVGEDELVEVRLGVCVYACVSVCVFWAMGVRRPSVSVCEKRRGEPEGNVLPCAWPRGPSPDHPRAPPSLAAVCSCALLQPPLHQRLGLAGLRRPAAPHGPPGIVSPSASAAPARFAAEHRRCGGHCRGGGPHPGPRAPAALHLPAPGRLPAAAGGR